MTTARPVARSDDLEQRPLPRLLLDLHGERFSGTLTLSRDRVSKRLSFHEGVPIFAESTLPSESLGVQLMDAGRISREDFSKVTELVRRRSCKEGKALLELGLLDPRSLFMALKDQVRLRVIECFGWPRGEFFLDHEASLSPNAQPFRVDLFALLQEGLEQHWGADRLLADLEPRMKQYPVRTPRLAGIAERLHRDDTVDALIGALDGSRSLRKSIQLARTARALATLWVLDATGALAYRDGPFESGQAGSASGPEVEITLDEAVAATRPDPGPEEGDARPAPQAKRDAAGQGLVREIAEKFAGLGDLDAYALVGVAPKASAAEIRTAYHRAARQYHPDALARLSIDPETREKANKVFAEISKAHAVISDPRRRVEYDRSRGSGDAAVDAQRLATAETLYRKGEILLHQGNFRGALEFLRPAVDTWPDEAAYQSALGWALYKKLPSDPEAAQEHLIRAARLTPTDGVVLFRLGMVLRALGQQEESAALLERARQLKG